jgi:dihydroorotate dehydrogenase electron transfer subunit
VCRADGADGTFDLLWKAMGAGTNLMAKSRKGDHFSVLGPLGNGFAMPAKKTKQAIIVAGGLGVAPMPILLDHLAIHGVASLVLLGARSKDELWGAELFESQGANVRLATDDGSAGMKGFVTELLHEELQQKLDVEVYACGPMPMLAIVSEMCVEAKISAQLSVETMMGCGFGICMGCPIVPAGGVSEYGRYLLACTDGPVFSATAIHFSQT